MDDAERAAFARFAQERLGAVVFEPDGAAEQEQIFATSLASARVHMAWTAQARDAGGRPFRLLTGMLERMTPNALADTDGTHHVIAVHQALIATIVEFALFAFTQRGIFAHIGDAAGEDSPAPVDGRAPGLMLLDRTLAGETVIPDAHRHRIPKDAQRHVAAVYLALMMGRFVWLHELSHCMDGHVGFAQAHGLAPRLHEVPEAERALVGFVPAQVSEDRLALLRALELEADAAALIGTCRIQLQDMENIDGIKAFDLGTRLCMTLFAGFAMAWLFEEYQGYLRTQRGETHPVPRARLANLIRAAAKDIAPESPEFVQLVGIAKAQFDALANVIPSMASWAGNEGDADPMTDLRHTLRDELASRRYVV